MRFTHRFCTRAPLADVASFHSLSESMAAITPPIVPIKMEKAPEHLSDRDQIAFTMWLGPLPVRWHAYVGDVSPTGFTDQQLEGPFRYWVHRHTFHSLDRDTTAVMDEVRAGLRWHPLWAPVGLAMWVGLPLLFAYRAWKTRRLLEGRGDQ